MSKKIVGLISLIITCLAISSCSLLFQEYIAPDMRNIYVPELGQTLTYWCFKNVYSFEQYANVTYDYTCESNNTSNLSDSVKKVMTDNDYVITAFLTDSDTNYNYFVVNRKSGSTYYLCYLTVRKGM